MGGGWCCRSCCVWMVRYRIGCGVCVDLCVWFLVVRWGGMLFWVRNESVKVVP